MRYKRYIKVITKNLAEYKSAIDILAGDYRKVTEENQLQAEGMRGKWTDEYITEWINENDPVGKYSQMIRDTRNKYEPIIMGNLEILERQINSFFNDSVSVEFSNKIMAIKTSGLQLTNREFKVLKDSIKSFLEARLFNQLAETRTKTVKRTVIDNSGNAEMKEVEEKDPYLLLDLPDTEEIFQAFNSFSIAVRRLINDYCGKDASLYEAAGISKPKHMCITSDSYFRNKAEEELLAVLDKASEILPHKEHGNELTEAERQLIDTMINPNYPSLARTTVHSVVNKNKALADILWLDERYRAYVEEMDLV